MLKSLKLKWKISIITSIILILILAAVGLVIYNYSTQTVKEQVNAQINILSNTQKNSIDKIISGLDREIKLIPKNSMVSMFTDMAYSSRQKIENLKKKGASSQDIQTAESDFSSLISGSGSLAISIGKTLKENLINIQYAKFSYITLADGTVISDSRVNSITGDVKITDYLKKELPPAEYKNIVFGRLKYIDNTPYLLYNAPIMSSKSGDKKQKVMGYVVLGLSTDIITKNLNSDLGEFGSITLINDKGIILNHENKKKIGKKIEDSWYLNQIKNGVKSLTQSVDNSFYLLKNIEGQELYMGTKIPLSLMYKSVYQIGQRIIYISVAGIIITFLLVFLLISWQLKPLERFMASFEKLKDGYLKEDVLLGEDDIKRKDEIGALAKAFNNMVDQLQSLITSVKNASTQLITSTHDMSETTEQVTQTAEQVGSAVQNVASGAEEQSAQIEETRGNVENLNNQIEEIDDSSRKISEDADNVITSIEEGNKSVNNSISQINNVKEETTQVARIISSLGEASAEIGDIVELISGISNQTNLLALNAAIEAARAGEAGRGFSVVADEIRELAEESSNATEKINGLIQEIQSDVNNAVGKMDENEETVDTSVEAIEETGVVFNKIEEVASQLRNSINAVTDNTQQMAGDSKEVEMLINNITKVSEEFASNSEEIAASSEEQIASTDEIASKSRELSKMAQELSETINRFEI